MRRERVVAISPDHPSVPGHFPGHPVVPGVVLLMEVTETLCGCLGEAVRVTGLPAVKFASPLRPGEPVTIHVEIDQPGQAAFSCRVGDRLVAAGTVDFDAAGAGTGAR